eukprot:TRINITY_DN6576_c0_g1_i5.p1 TRINITY_DN6576_c0_g1~~TRINITY_DN6576_c0_g1_i5.p1  ORF type:complete len:216 (-),score=31.27 TRINITY_DN6576_c0_g1_i5:170-757(-)
MCIRDSYGTDPNRRSKRKLNTGFEFIDNYLDDPVYIIFYVLVAALLFRWALLNSENKRKKSYKEDLRGLSEDDEPDDAVIITSAPPNAVYLDEIECSGRSIQELAAMQKSGNYVLPLRYENLVQEYRRKHEKPIRSTESFNFARRYNSNESDQIEMISPPPHGPEIRVSELVNPGVGAKDVVIPRIKSKSAGTES